MGLCFPWLHQNATSNLARRLTEIIRDNMDTLMLAQEHAKQRKNEFTSRSTRKGTMTENRVHPDLNVAEEYIRSGHTRRNTNINVDAEGHIEQIPARTHLMGSPLLVITIVTLCLLHSVSTPLAMYK